MKLQASLGLLAVVASVSIAAAADAPPVKSGTHVFARAADVKLYDGEREVGTVYPGMMLEAIKIQDQWIWVGRGWVASKDVVPMSSAVAFFDEQISKQPMKFALVTRARVKYEQQDYIGAVSDCDLALATDADDVAAHAMRARTLVRLARHDEAMTDANHAIKHDPKFAVAYSVRGHIELETGHPQQAIDDFTRSLDIDPKSAWALGGRGRAYARIDDCEKAIDDFSAALALNPHLSAVWNNRGNAWFKKGDYTHAVADYSAALDLKPTAQIYFNRAIAWERLGAHEKADRDLAKAGALDPNFRHARRKGADTEDDQNS